MDWVGAKEVRDTFGVKPGSLHDEGSPDLASVRQRAAAGQIKAWAKAYFVGDACQNDAIIPKEFWRDVTPNNFQQDWERGDFIRLRFREHEQRAIGVSFDRQDLEAMGWGMSRSVLQPSEQREVGRELGMPLAGIPKKIPSSNEWQRQTREGQTLRLLHNFLQSADQKAMLRRQTDHRSLQFLFDRFKTYCADHKDRYGNSSPVDPKEFSAFKKWAKRYREGSWGERFGAQTGQPATL